MIYKLSINGPSMIHQGSINDPSMVHKHCSLVAGSQTVWARSHLPHLDHGHAIDGAILVVSWLGSPPILEKSRFVCYPHAPCMVYLPTFG